MIDEHRTRVVSRTVCPSANTDVWWRGTVRLMVLATCLLAITESTAKAQSRFPIVSPDEVGIEPSDLAPIDEVVNESIRYDRMPGAVVIIGFREKIIWRKAYGLRQEKPEPLPMQVDTVFDLASLTKPIATATSIMKLAESGKIDLNAPVSKYIPEFTSHGKDKITVYQLLTHQGGLIPDNALKDYDDGPKKAFERIHDLKLRADPGSDFIYTDVGFIVLAELVRRVSGQNIHDFTQKNFFEPLGLNEIGYVPSESLKKRAATTEQREDRWMVGEVHDPRAYRLEGIAGHAGLFSTADNLAVYAQMLLNRGIVGNTRVLEPITVDQMTRSYEVPGGRRGLGWDIRTGYSSNRGDSMSGRAFGHGGFTGTGLWIDPELELFVIFLSNRVHPDGKGYVNPTIGRVGTLAASAARAARRTDDSPQSRLRTNQTTETVLAGIDVLSRRNFFPLKNLRVGLITNHTGRSLDGQTTVRLMMDSDEVDLRCLFSPEHGLEGKLDISRIGDAKDTNTGLQIYSLYGASREPSAEQLKTVDALVFDIQDIGTRFYTYISTMGLAMKAAAAHDKKFFVLDRPNPIGGLQIQGPVLDDGLQSFVGFHTIPVRHGMTTGELARMMKEELEIDLDLTVVPCANWHRDHTFDQTGRTWINPSPNMRNLTQAMLYPGIGLIETTNVSVGRGTDTPFEIIGAPWIDAQKLAANLNKAELPGVRAIPIEFTPESSKYKGELCRGINFQITSTRQFDPMQLGLELARQLRIEHPDDWQTKSLNRLLGNKAVHDAILETKTVNEMRLMYEPELARFARRRQQFLLY